MLREILEPASEEDQEVGWEWGVRIIKEGGLGGPLSWRELASGACVPDETGLALLQLQLPSLDKRRVIGQENMVWNGKPHYLSTIFLVINHSFTATPLLYETMLFEGHEPPFGDLGLQWRYSTRENAEIGHRTIKEALEVGISSDNLRELLV